MMNKIIYKLKKFKIRLLLKLRNEFIDGDADSMNKLSRRKNYIVKILSNPIKTIKALNKKTLDIKYIEIALTTKCTLNCKGCSALMEYYDKHYNISIEKNIESLKNLLNACDSLNYLRLLGGEPLYYDNLYDMLVFINKQNKIKTASIVTNGTLLIKDNRIIEILKNKKFNIFISDYGDISRKKNELIKQLEQNKIKYILSKKDFIWRDYGNLTCRNRTKKQLEKQFSNCKITCSSILDGKLHHCPRSSHGTNINKIPLRNEDYIDLLDKNISSSELRKKLNDFFYNYVPYVEACNYCNNATKELKHIKAGQQIKKS